MDYCSINGQLTEASEARISVRDRGFRYGDGLFETMALEGGVPYRFEWHMQRLADGLAALKIPCDTTALQVDCRRLLQQSKAQSGFLRLQVTRGEGGKGYLPDDQCSATIVIETLPAAPPPDGPVRLWQSSYRKLSPQALPVRYKLCQGLNSTLARMEAAEQDCFDALMLNDGGQVCETSSASLIWRKDGVLYTPSLGCGILEGSTRAALLELAPLQEVQASLDALIAADAVCIANVAWKCLPVAALLPLNAEWQSGALAAQLRRLIERDREAYCVAHAGSWQQVA